MTAKGTGRRETVPPNPQNSGISNQICCRIIATSAITATNPKIKPRLKSSLPPIKTPRNKATNQPHDHHRYRHDIKFQLGRIHWPSLMQSRYGGCLQVKRRRARIIESRNFARADTNTICGPRASKKIIAHLFGWLSRFWRPDCREAIENLPLPPWQTSARPGWNVRPARSVAASP